MTSPSKNKPSFLSRAKLISESKNPEFLSRAKLVNAPEEQYVTDEQIEKDIERSQAVNTSRILEGVLGLPGDLVNFAGGLFGFEPGAPGSEQLKEFSQKITGGYTKPQNEFEERVGETMQDIALFSTPGAKHYSFARNLGIPIVANLAKEGVKYSTGSKGNQDAAKVGSMVVLDLLSHRKSLGNAKEYASSLFKKADDAIPKGLSIKSSSLEKSLNNLESVLKAGGERPSTGDALQKISEIKKEIKDGKIDLKNLVAYRPSINEMIDKYKGFDINVKPAIREKIINNLNKVKGEVIKSAQEYGEKYNPEFLNLSKSANEAYAAYSQSNKITNFIQKHAASRLKSNAAKTLLFGAAGFGSAGIGAGMGTLAAASAAPVVGAGYKIFKTIMRSKSPTLRNHYMKIIEGASKGNSAQVIKNAKALDKQMKEMDETGEFDTE